jgi:capsid protein
MSHRSSKADRKAERARLADMSARGVAVPPAAAASYGYGWGTNGHLGADSSRLRGMVYFPELDTRREISDYTRTELLRKARFLYANYGIAKRIVNGLSRMVAGTGLTPQAGTTDKAWNTLAEKEFARVADSPFVFDVGGRYDFAKAQQALLRFGYRDGDAAALLTSSEAGSARFAFYEGHQIGNSPIMPAGQDQALWRDGVRLDGNNRAIAYRFIGDAGKFTDVASENVMIFCDYERAGQSRGITALSHAVNHLLDAAEITGFIKTGVKLANQYGWWVEYDSPTTPGSGGAGGRVGSPGNKTTVQTEAGPITLDRLYGAGAIPDLPPGAKLKFNGSQHPHPNNLTLIDYLIRDIAWGVGLSPEILWNIAALGGANTRFVLADAQGWIEQQQAELVRLFCGRVWVYTIAKAIKTGRLPKCQDPEWWRHGWIPPPRLTVDFGREGKLHIEQLKMGIISYSRLLGWQGQDFETHTNQFLDEIAFFKAGLNAENAAAYKPGTDRNLSWDDVQQWRNSIGFRPADDGTASLGTVDPDSGVAAASAFMAEIAKDPARAEAWLNQLRAEAA